MIYFKKNFKTLIGLIIFNNFHSFSNNKHIINFDAENHEKITQLINNNNQEPQKTLLNKDYNLPEDTIKIYLEFHPKKLYPKKISIDERKNKAKISIEDEGKNKAVDIIFSINQDDEFIINEFIIENEETSKIGGTIPSHDDITYDYNEEHDDFFLDTIPSFHRMNYKKNNEEFILEKELKELALLVLFNEALRYNNVKGNCLEVIRVPHVPRESKHFPLYQKFFIFKEIYNYEYPNYFTFRYYFKEEEKSILKNNFKRISKKYSGIKFKFIEKHLEEKPCQLEKA